MLEQVGKTPRISVSWLSNAIDLMASKDTTIFICVFSVTENRRIFRN